uniref:AB hydrolase-1 domain-containing protein n=1 Tax=Haptolina ericina TaxID=156174 RepID=A0A7S3BLJ8_9EUKA
MHDITVSKIIDQLGMSAGLSTLRFNFRSGLGRGHGSAADVRGACAFVMQTAAAAEQIVLIGYSYGASVVASIAADIPEVAAFALIAPPLGANPCLFMCRSPITSRLLTSTKPKLLIVGDSDQFCSPQYYEALAEQLTQPKKCQLITGSHDRSTGRFAMVSLRRARVYGIPMWVAEVLRQHGRQNVFGCGDHDGIPDPVPDPTHQVRSHRSITSISFSTLTQHYSLGSRQHLLALTRISAGRMVFLYFLHLRIVSACWRWGLAWDLLGWDLILVRARPTVTAMTCDSVT